MQKPNFKNQLLTSFLCILIFSCSQKNEEKAERKEPQGNYIPKEGYVPDEKTAIRIAEAVWLPIYDTSIYMEKPFKARLKDGIWYVEGTLPEGMLGGVAYADIRKSNGEILRVIHTK